MDPAPNPSLAELFELAAKQESDDLQRTKERIMRIHGGLGAMMYKQFGSTLLPNEICGWMWEALPLAIEAWTSGAGSDRAPTTEWRYQTMCLFRSHQKQHIYLDAVKVPYRYKHTRKGTQATKIEDLESVLNDCVRIEDYTDRLYASKTGRPAKQ